LGRVIVQTGCPAILSNPGAAHRVLHQTNPPHPDTKDPATAGSLVSVGEMWIRTLDGLLICNLLNSCYYFPRKCPLWQQRLWVKFESMMPPCFLFTIYYISYYYFITVFFNSRSEEKCSQFQGAGVLPHGPVEVVDRLEQETQNDGSTLIVKPGPTGGRLQESCRHTCLAITVRGV
jgi:hypothetical protein